MIIEFPDPARLCFPGALDRRLHRLLDQQDRGVQLNADEQAEAEALVELAELLTLLRLRAERALGAGAGR